MEKLTFTKSDQRSILNTETAEKIDLFFFLLRRLR